MKYFFDTEFLEGTQTKRIFGIPYGKTPNTIDLISIGIVSENNREYYAVSKDFNLKEAWNRFQMKQVYGDARNRYPDGIREYWIRENVLKPIFDDLHFKSACDREFPFQKVSNKFTYQNFKRLIDCYGKTNKQIAFEIMQFALDPADDGFTNWLGSSESYIKALKEMTAVKPEFYAYYADYDWVVFCWLFGEMIDLPKGFPMYCRDLKQMLDEIKFEVSDNVEMWGKNLKKHPDYPKQENEHNALDDARWNLKLYNFIQSL